MTTSAYLLIAIFTLFVVIFLSVFMLNKSSNDDDKKIVAIKENNNVVQKTESSTCGCSGKKKQPDETKIDIVEDKSKVVNSKEQLLQNLTTVYNTSCQQITNFYSELLKKTNNQTEQLIMKNELQNVIEKLTEKFNSDKLNILNNSPQVTTQTQNKKKALLIGINYIGSKHELKGCLNDVELIQSRLQLSYGFNTVNIKKLTDLTPQKPTRQNIIIEFTNLLKNAVKNDVLFFFYSGHGSNTVDRNKDEKDGKDEMIVSLDLKGVLDDEFKQIIQQHLKDGITLFAIFDSCFSGTVLDLKYQYMENGNNNVVTRNDKVSETSGNVFMISGCADWQTSADAYIQKQFRGAMTWSFLESLQSNISWKNLLIRMRNSLKSKGFSQFPQISSGKLINLDSIVKL